jgi:predicted glycosyltransferase
MKIWIDLDNSPHVLFFKPIIERLKAEQIETLITVRSFSQTEELASQHGLSYSLIGEHRNPRHFATRVTSTLRRAGQLAHFVRRQRPDVAISHGSRALVLAAWSLGIPSMTLYDYEFVSAAIFNRLSKRILVPAIITHERLREQSLDGRKFRAYPGLKEEVYIYDVEPDSGVLRDLNLDSKRLIITVRPQANWAHYHDRKSEVLFSALIDRLRKEQDAQVIIIPRTQAQHVELTAQYRLTEPQFRVLDRAVDGLSLMWFSDAVFSGGGTMVREAALLGVNVYSTFAGKLGAADQQLASEGKLKLVREPAEVDRLVFSKRTGTAPTNHRNQRHTKEYICQQVINFAEEYTDRPSSPRSCSTKEVERVYDNLA